MARIQGCCGCFDLRNGSIAVGAASVTVASICFGFFLMIVIRSLEVHPRYFSINPDVGWVMAIAMTIEVACIVFDSLLIHGAKTGRRPLVLAWMIFSLILGVLKTLSVILGIGLYVYMVHPLIVLPATWVIGVLLLILWTATEWYWLVVVFRYFRTMPMAEGAAGQFGYKPQSSSQLELNTKAGP